MSISRLCPLVPRADSRHVPLMLAFLGACLLLAVTACGDSTAPDPDPLEFSAWSAPVNLGTVNSPQSDNHPGLSADGLSLYFHSNRPGGQGGEDLYVVRRTSANQPWGAPVNLAGFNTSANDRVPFLSRDGRQLFFGSNRTGGPGGNDLYVSTRSNANDDAGWTAPVPLGTAVNSTADDDGALLLEDPSTGRSTLYFTSIRAGGLGDWDVYASVRNPDGSFAPAVLVPELSSAGRDTRAAIRADGLEFFLTSNRTGSQDLDIWVFTRSSASAAWSAGERLPAPINSELADGAPALSRDARTLVFYSNRSGGLGQNDLYAVTRTKLSGRDP